mmetsp:Transcript_81404/g.233927  ORF Transcript_81404/g.233927 Transcript_81404/m.233927 type:complete len:254 (-) Transcript_81404:820-1581(-)
MAILYVLVRKVLAAEQLHAEIAPKLHLRQLLGVRPTEGGQALLPVAVRARLEVLLPDLLLEQSQLRFLVLQLLLQPIDLGLGLTGLCLQLLGLLTPWPAAATLSSNVETLALHLSFDLGEVDVPLLRQLPQLGDSPPGRGPCPGPVRQEEPDDVGDVRVEARRELRQLSFALRARQLHLAELGEGHLPREELEQDDAERVDIRLLRDAARGLVEHLGRRPDRRDASERGVHADLLPNLREPEVADLDVERAAQ